MPCVLSSLAWSTSVADAEFKEVALSNRGKLWSYTTNHYKPPEPYISPDPFEPYTVAAVELNEERIKHWMEQGAKPTDRVLRFLDEAGLAKRPARNNPNKAKPGKKAQERLDELAQKEEDAKAAVAELTMQIDKAEHGEWLARFKQHFEEEFDAVILPELFPGDGAITMGEVVTNTHHTRPLAGSLTGEVKDCQTPSHRQGALRFGG